MTKLEWFGVGLTTLYLLGIAIVVKTNWEAFSVLQPNAWGDFFAGSLGPLGIFWLVLGYFQQGRELQNSVNALNLQAEELRHSVEQQKAMVGITEKQLDLSIQASRRDRLLSEERQLPFFQLSKSSSQPPMTIGMSQTVRFELRNSGADADTVYLSMSASGFDPSPNKFLGFPSGKTQVIDLPIELAVLATAEMTILSTNLSGQIRRQQFDVSHDGATMTSCFPERA